MTEKKVQDKKARMTLASTKVKFIVRVGLEWRSETLCGGRRIVGSGLLRARGSECYVFELEDVRVVVATTDGGDLMPMQY